MLTNIGFKRSDLEKFMILSITGGIPWYLEQIDPDISAQENIKKLCFEPDGLLVDEFKYIFSDLFGRRSNIYKKIIKYLAKTPAEFEEIALGIKYEASGALSDYLNELIMSGFLKRDLTWFLKGGKESKLSKYRLSDNYLRFFLRYMSPKLDRIKKGQFMDIDLSSFAGLQRDRKSTRLNSSHIPLSRMPSSA